MIVPRLGECRRAAREMVDQAGGEHQCQQPGDTPCQEAPEPCWDPDLQVSVSYPKFQTAEGTYVSLKHGIWDTESETYDDSRFTFRC